MSANDPSTQFHSARNQLRQATDQILDACLKLQLFCDQTQVWTDFADDAAPTVADLAERRKAIETARSALKLQFTSLAAEGVLLDAAWKTHAAAMRQVPRPQPVADDPRISSALATQFERAEDDATLAAIYTTLEELGLEPEGPDWARWALEVRHGRLHWVPFLPLEPETPPVWPEPINAVSDDTPAATPDEDRSGAAAADRAGLGNESEGEAV